jgi:rod shape-determining protein MreC
MQRRADRDDFIIAVRSALLKRGTQQKFSLLVLIIISGILLSLEVFDNRYLNFFRSGVKDIIYRSSFVVSAPSNVASFSFEKIINHFGIYKQNKLLKEELEKYKNKESQIGYLQTENKKLKESIEAQYSFTYEPILSKVLVDKDSPFLKSVIINKGSNKNIKKGMPVLDKTNLVGRVIDVNFFSSRVLLISDLNSRIPVIIEPNGYQGILVGTGKEFGDLKFLQTKYDLNLGDKVFTSGSDGIFYPGISIGTIDVDIDAESSSRKIKVKYYSDLSQLYLVNVLKIDQGKED